MRKILFDASIHLGQFTIGDDALRRACKNSQAQFSIKPYAETVGVITFNENSWVDHIVWTLPENEQDAFYRFMDTFHSITNIVRVPLRTSDCELAISLAKEHGMDISAALSCATAIREGVSEMHSLYPSLLVPEISEALLQRHKLAIRRSSPTQAEPLFAEGRIEQAYQSAFDTLRESKIDLLELLRENYEPKFEFREARIEREGRKPY